ncbi:MAG: hypothetical protein CSA68_05060 [Rhodobacterales bacterium]|nr:MAG: hypothetical protein CSA68_05060 [Rhodobacterales bacterium]
MNDTQLGPEEPANLKFLRRLVTILTGTMIVGVVVIIGLIVMRITAQPAAMGLPEQITLPEGVDAAAFTAAKGWYAVVSKQDEILIFSSKTGALQQRIQIKH